ncbi:MAG: alpha/beta fold hydrolase [Pseudomonadota bacterium]|nr:alpha/beta fold hydrolase [Pseudomonadota bacterium]
MQASQVTVDGVRLHLVSGGEGPVVLFLHGLPEFWYAWKAQLVAFARTHRVIAVDLPGVNLSAPLGGEPRLGVVGELIAGLIRTIAPGQRVSLVGHDVGAMIAWEVAARRPELVDRLVVINAPPAAHLAHRIAVDPAQEEASRYISRLRRPGVEEWLGANGCATLATQVFGSARAPDVFSAADRKAYLGVWSRPGGLTGILAYYRSWGLDVEPAPPVVAPTLVLWGMDDPFLLPGCLEGIEAHGRDVRVVRIPGATHWVAREEAGRVNAEIAALLASRPSPGPAPEVLRPSPPPAEPPPPRAFVAPVIDVHRAREAWRKDPEYSCFWSGPDNPRGLRLTPSVEPGRVWVRMRVERDHSGIVGIAHGGIAFTILDGLMGWLVMSHLGRVGVTSSATIRYQAPLRVGEEYEFEAVPERAVVEVDDAVQVTARVFPVGRRDRPCADMHATFFLPNRAHAEHILGRPVGALGDGIYFPPG